MAEDWQAGGFGLYIHWPFCEAKCPYCDFNSHVSRFIDHDAWCAAYLEEIERVAQITQGRVVRSVFFGGGTPSLMKPSVVGAILDKIGTSWSLANDVEITLEANPSSVEAGNFSAFAMAGVNRVSLGVQSLNDADLKRLGRLHTATEAIAAIDIAQTHFDRVNFDLIYARQDQTPDNWEKELKQALTMGVSHLSLYQLTIEDGTAFGDRFHAGKLTGLPKEERSADMYEMTQDICIAAGLPAYEVSNHARPDQESRHNIIYWKAGDYAGIGPGAHGRLTIDGKRLATEQTRHPRTWLAGERTIESVPLNKDEQAREFLLMGLRISEGVDLKRYASTAGHNLPQDRLNDLVDEGWLALSNDILSVTPRGRLLLNAILARLAP